jgi:hypothetical protein
MTQLLARFVTTLQRQQRGDEVDAGVGQMALACACRSRRVNCVP